MNAQREEHREVKVQGLTVRIIRSARRRKTISATLEGDTLIVRAPHTLSDADLARAIERLAKRVAARRQQAVDDQVLQRRAERCNRLYFGGQLTWRSIRFVSNQRRRFGSCDPARGIIRLSERLKRVPAFVLDYVIVHELAHLIEPNHSPRFWELVYRYRLAERARGYLMALAHEEAAASQSRP